MSLHCNPKASSQAQHTLILVSMIVGHRMSIIVSMWIMDNVIFTAKDPIKYIRIMEYVYQLKRVGVPDYYFEGDMKLLKDRKMSWSANIYIKT